MHDMVVTVILRSGLDHLVGLFADLRADRLRAARIKRRGIALARIRTAALGQRLIECSEYILSGSWVHSGLTICHTSALGR